KDGRDNLLEEFLISQSGQSSRTGLSRRQSPRCSPNFDTKYYLEGGVHMKFVREALRCSLFLCLAVLLLPVVALAQHYKQTNLVSDLASISTPNPPDPNLKNPWGLTRSPGGSPWWIANNNSGTSTLYDGNGNAFPPPSKGGPLVVTVPPPNGSPAGTTSTPTGVVFNGSLTDYLFAPGKSAHFIFVTEDEVTGLAGDRKNTRLNSSHEWISDA